MTGNIASRTKRSAPTHPGEADTHISELSLRQPVRLAASLVRKHSVATDGQLVHASSAAQVISSIENYRGKGAANEGWGSLLGQQAGKCTQQWLAWLDPDLWCNLCKQPVEHFAVVTARPGRGEACQENTVFGILTST